MELKQLRKQILMFLYSKGWRYLARDKFMYLRVYKNKPIKLENMIEWGDVGCINGSGSLMQFSELFDDVSWEDTEPLDIRKELGDSIFEKVNKYEGLRKYLADVCYYIDFLFSVVFIIYVVRWAKTIIELFIDKAKQNRLWSPKGPKNTAIEDLYIFSTEAGNPIDISSTNKKLRDINYKKRLSTHVFRHTHISLLAEAGVPFKAIMQRVGHNDPNTTLAVYTHVTEKMQSAATNAVNSIGQLLSKKVAT